jgi:hypothetical protein
MSREEPGFMLAAGEFLAVVEVTPEPEGCTFADLVSSTYYDSQKGLIVLVLNGVTPGQVDAVLDPIVPLLPLTIPGLRYCDVDDLAALRDAVLHAREVRCQISTLLRLEGTPPVSGLPKSERKLVGPEGFEPPTWPL